jgi:hypothetical protein
MMRILPFWNWIFALVLSLRCLLPSRSHPDTSIRSFAPVLTFGASAVCPVTTAAQPHRLLFNSRAGLLGSLSQGLLPALHRIVGLGSNRKFWPLRFSQGLIWSKLVLCCPARLVLSALPISGQRLSKLY